MQRIAAQPVAEGFHVLARQQRRRHDHRDLLAVHRGDERGAQGHFGLAEADIAADSRSIGRPDERSCEHGGDGGLLIVGFLVRKAGAEFVVQRPEATDSRGASRNCRSAAILISSPAMSRMRFFIRALRGLPGGAAEPVELGAGLIGAVAREEFDVLDRQE